MFTSQAKKVAVLISALVLGAAACSPASNGPINKVNVEIQAADAQQALDFISICADAGIRRVGFITEVELHIVSPPGYVLCRRLMHSFERKNMEEKIYGDVDREGIEVILHDGRLFVRYDVGAHQVVWLEDEISQSDLADIRRGGAAEHAALLDQQKTAYSVGPESVCEQLETLSFINGTQSTYAQPAASCDRSKTRSA